MTDTNTQGQSSEELVAAYLRTGEPALRAAAIEQHEALVRSLARRFVRPGIPMEDLVQTAWVALIRALDRFDPTRGVNFGTFAVPCVVGEIKRFFRDCTWNMKVPRRLQEIAVHLSRMEEQLGQELQREPTVQEMAEAFEVSEEDLLHAMEAYRGYHPSSLGEGRDEVDDQAPTPLAQHGWEDEELAAVVAYAPLRAALEDLDTRDRQLLRLRFWEGCSQREAAEELRVSQMHVSRLERKVLEHLRAAVAPG